MKAEVALPPLSTAQRLLLFVALACATFLMILDYSIANVSLPYIAGDLAISTDQGIYVITSFAVGNAIGLPLTGWLSSRLGQVRTLTLSVVLFTIFSWACGGALNFETLVVSRFIQGFVSGPIIPLSQSLLLSTSPEGKKQSSLAIWMTIVVVAPVIGPILGGYISDWYIWRWIFYINIPVGIFSSVIIWSILSDRETVREKVPIDYIGIIFLGIGVTALQILLDKGQQWDWWNSLRIRVLSISSFVAFTFLIIWELFHKKPFLELKLFSRQHFSISIVCLAFSYAIFFGSVVLIPLWLQTFMGYNATWAGIAIAPVGFFPLFLSLLIPKVMQTIGALRTLMIAFLLFGISCFFSAFMTTSFDIEWLWTLRLIFSLGVPFYFNPLVTLSVQGLSNEKLPSATGLFYFVRSMVSGIGTSIFTTLWERRTIYHHERVGSQVSLYDPNTIEYLRQLQEFDIQGDKGLTVLNRALDIQASLLAMNDAFYLMGWTFVALILVLVFFAFKQRCTSDALTKNT